MSMHLNMLVINYVFSLVSILLNPHSLSLELFLMVYILNSFDVLRSYFVSMSCPLMLLMFQNF